MTKLIVAALVLILASPALARPSWATRVGYAHTLSASYLHRQIARDRAWINYRTQLHRMLYR